MRKSKFDGQVISVKMRNNHFALCQVLYNGNIVVFDLFSESGDWGELLLAHENILFITIVSKSVFAKSQIKILKNILPINGVEIPQKKISIGSGFREIRCWEGTEEERVINMLGLGVNKLRKVSREGGKILEEYTPILNEEYDKYSKFELTGVDEYPAFNERLFLCETFKRNVDPLKELAFNRKIPIEYKVYVDIISGKVPNSDLGY